ncbi:MAG: cupredoxin family copper-binding protein [Nanoarchaeota archaeon]
MKKSVILVIAIISLLVAGCSQPIKSTAPDASVAKEKAAGNVVTISGFAFDPAEIKVNAGSSVTWINEDSAPHTIKFDAFESEKLNSGDKYEHTFAAAGEYAYVCSIHPSMKGKVIVQ